MFPLKNYETQPNLLILMHSVNSQATGIIP